MVERFNNFMDRLNKDTKIGEFLEILLREEVKLKDISKETINFDDVMRKIGMNPNDYQVKSKFLGIFDEVKEYNEYLQSIQAPDFEQIYLKNKKNEENSSKVPNFASIMSKVQNKDYVRLVAFIIYY